jgi:anti-anti-sigma factor
VYRPQAYPEVETAVLDMLNKGAGPIVLDLDAVAALDTEALRGLIRLLRRARSAGGDIALRSSRADLLRTLSVTALDRVFAVEQPLAA